MGDFIVRVRKDNFAKFALFTDHHGLPSGDTVWFTGETNFAGPIHTNERYNFAFDPSGIFEGEVKKVFAVPGANMAVIVRHGHYLTLYSNIVNVRVKQGDKIGSDYHIGDVYFSEKDKGSMLHLRIYEETKVLNPKNWLSRH